MAQIDDLESKAQHYRSASRNSWGMRQELQRAIYHELLAVASRAGIPENDAALQTAHDLYRKGQGLIFGVDDLQLEAIWTLSLRLDTYFRESAPEPKSE